MPTDHTWTGPESESLHKLRLDSSALSMFSSSSYHLLSPLLAQTHTHPFLTGPMPLQGGQYYSASDFCTRSFGRKFCPGSANISCIGWRSAVGMVRGDMFSKPRRFSDSHQYSKTILLFVVRIGAVNLYDIYSVLLYLVELISRPFLVDNCGKIVLTSVFDCECNIYPWKFSKDRQNANVCRGLKSHPIRIGEIWPEAPLAHFPETSWRINQFTFSSVGFAWL